MRSLAILIALAMADLAVADPTGNAEIDKGIAEYDDQEYERAVVTLEKALQGKNLTRQELVEGYRTLALSHVALGQDDQARTAFRRLLEVDPRYRLPRTENPRALDLFDEVRASMPEATMAGVVAKVTPDKPRPGNTLTLALGVDDPEGHATRVTVHYRTRGKKSFSSVNAKKTDEGWEATISGAFVETPALEYHVVAVGERDAVIAALGSPELPVVLVIAAPGGTTPIYGKWWFWAGIGGAAVATTAAILLLGGGADVPEDMVDVTITVN
jgi:tetratricopeptide (TPR) repeat protein